MIGEASHIKGQEYRVLSKVVDDKGNKINTQSNNDNIAGTTSTGRGGVLDSVAQNHIEDLDVEKEKALLESKDIITEYGMYISGQLVKAANEYSDSSKSQLEKRVLDDIKTLSEMGISEQKISNLITDEYYGGNSIFKLAYKNGNYDNPTQEELEDACKIIKTILRLRMNYVNKITSLMQKMLRINYRVLGLSEEQAKIYIDSLGSNDNSSVKTVGDIKNIIFANKDKFITNGGKSVDLRKLGFGVILCGDEELGFAGSKSNEEAMFKLIQQAMRYDVVVVAHGGERGKNVNVLSDEDEKSFDNEWKDYINGLYDDVEEKILDQIESKFQNHKKALSFINNFNRIIEDNMFNYISIFQEESKKLNSSEKDNLLEACKKATEECINRSSKVASDAIAAYDKKIKRLEVEDEDDERFKQRMERNLEIIKTKNLMVLIVEHYLYGKLNDANLNFIKTQFKYYWHCQPTRTLKAGPFEDVNELVRQLIKEGYKKILIEDCNPGGHKLADDIMNTKGILINHSNFSNYVESSLIDTNDQNYLSIYEAESQLKIFAESYGIDYDDDQYLNECCSWYKNNYDIIQEGKIIDVLKVFFKKVIGAIIGFVKGIIGLIKKVFHKLKEKFNGTKEEPKDTDSKFQKPIDASFIDIKSNKVVKVSANNRKDLEKVASDMCSAISGEIKKINSKQQSSMKKIEKDIDALEKQENNNIHHESFVDIDILEFISMGQNLLEAVDFLNEFQEDENGNPVNNEDETDDSDYTVDDSSDSGDGNTDPETNDDNEPSTDDYSMDNNDTDTQSNDQAEDEPDTKSDNAQQDDQNQNDDDYEIPDDDEDAQQNDQQNQGNDENPNSEAPEPDGDDEFSMDDNTTDDSTADGNSGDSGYQSSNDVSSDSEDNTSEKLKDLESIVFDDLSSEEKKMKIKELKDLYIAVYNKCGSILELITGIRKDEETVQIIEYISNTLIDLKQYVNDYMNDVFDSKTYMENLSQLQKYIMILTAINKVFTQIRLENE